MNVRQISEVIGRNFFEVFKPNGKWNEIVSHALEELRSGKSPKEVFDLCGGFKDGFAVVRLNDKYNWIRQDNGQFFSERWFDWCGDFKDGLAVVILNGKENWIRQDNGQFFSERWLDWCGVFHDGFAKVKLNGKWNYIDTKGRLYNEQPKNLAENKRRTIIIKENVLNEVEEVMKPTESRFNANVRYFLHQLLDDPVNAEIPTCIKMANISRSRFIKMLIDRGIVIRTEKLNDTDKDGNHKPPTMSVKYKVVDKVPDELEYKVSKTDFDRKIEKLRRSIFEKNLYETKFNTRLGDQLAVAKNSPLTMGFIAPPEKKHDTVSWLMNRAVEAWNAELEDNRKEQPIDEEGGCGGATAASASGQFSQPLFGMVRRKINEKLNSDPKYGNRYRDLGGGFDVQLDNGSIEKSLVTIQNKTTNTLYHICFDGSNFNIYRDNRDGEPCSHVSYVFDKLLDAFDNNGYTNVNETLEENNGGKVFKISEEQAKAIEEATATTTVGNYAYDVPLGVDSSDETMKRHNGKGGSVSINIAVNESNKELFHTSKVNEEMSNIKQQQRIIRIPQYKQMLQGGVKNVISTASHYTKALKLSEYNGGLNIDIKRQIVKPSNSGNFMIALEQVANSLNYPVYINGRQYNTIPQQNQRQIQNDANIQQTQQQQHKNNLIVGIGTLSDGGWRGLVPKEANKYMPNDPREVLNSLQYSVSANFNGKDATLKHGFAGNFYAIVCTTCKDRVNRPGAEVVYIYGLQNPLDNQMVDKIFRTAYPDFVPFRNSPVANERNAMAVSQLLNSQQQMNESKNKTHKDWLEEHGIEEKEVGLGFSEKEQKWYGWSHRAACGFGIGDKFKECYPTGTKTGKIIKTLDQAKEAAEKFADSVS